MRINVGGIAQRSGQLRDSPFHLGTLQPSSRSKLFFVIPFFRDTFHGNPPALDRDLEADAGGQWSADALEVLTALVGAILFWKTYPRTSGHEDERTFLQLDRSRLSELTEAWIPVRTVYGPGVLIFDNSD